MDARTKVKVDLIGQWAEHRQTFSADIYEYFGYGVKRFHNEIHNGDVTFMRVESTEPVYETPEDEDIVESSIHSIDGRRFERITLEEDTFGRENDTDFDEIDDLGLFEDAGEEDIVEFPRDRGEPPYPGLYPWFIVALMVVGGVLLAVIYGMVRNYGLKGERQRYKFTGI